MSCTDSLVGSGTGVTTGSRDGNPSSIIRANSAIQILALSLHTIIINVEGLFGSFGNEPMQSCSVRRVSLSLSSSAASASASVYSPPSDRFDHRSFISYKYMQLCP